MTKCRQTEKNNVCSPTPAESQTPVICTPFDVCLPFGRTLSFNGECLSLSGTPTIADGEYGVIVVQNGCIVDARQNPVFEYTPPPCAPAATPCGDSDGGSITPWPSACNLIKVDAGGRLGAFAYLDHGEGITVTGCGSEAEPFVISLDVNGGAGDVYITAGTQDVITVEGAGSLTNPFVISHVEHTPGPGNIGGFELDAYGHIVGYQDVEEGAIRSILEGPGIAVQVAGGVATISLKSSPVGASRELHGGFYVETDIAGRVVGVEQGINIPAGTYDPMTTLFTLNAYGSVTAVGTTARNADTSFSMLFPSGRPNTTMQFTTTQQGMFRIAYTGDLGAGSGTGLIPLPAPFTMYVDGNYTPAYAKVVGGRIAEVHAVTSARYGVGVHNVSIITNSEDPYTDIGIMDVTLIEMGR